MLRLFAPFLPFTAEQIFQDVFPKTAKLRGSIHQRGFWPQADNWPRNEDALRQGQLCLEILAAVRGAKSDRGVSLKAPITQLTVHAAPAEQIAAAGLLADLTQTVSAAAVSFAAPHDDSRFSLTIDWAAVPITA